MTMPGRKYVQSGAAPYRYSINGQEKELELNENITTAEYWEYDSRIGRRWNIDPKPNINFSPYSTFEDNPIWHNDIKGDTTGGPGPTPVQTGTSSYYIKRAWDFVKRNPGKAPPTYYLEYGNTDD